MHPEILRLMSDQRSREMRAQAHQARLVRSIRFARRGRHLPGHANEFVPPPIPDYVDGSFRIESADLTDGPVTSETGHASAAQRAA
jgi:hypothetical protein